jgi:predicted dehydrogenase/sugar phosphate isomerase/epimerase
MTRKVMHVALNGVTGRMGYRQHLVRSLLAIREQGGVPLEDGTSVYPEPILVGRNSERLRAVAERHGLERWTTSLDEVLADPEVDVYFDTQVTSARVASLLRAIEAGKHVYTEKPVAGSLDGALRLARAAKAAGITHGVVHDKLFLPGVMKLQRLLGGGFFGRVLSVRLEFGYWVFEGDEIPAQRPSWNYRAEAGGGIVLDMFPHWQYLLTDLFGPISAVYARATTHIPRRWDESGTPYDATADDAAYAVLEFADGTFASVNSSWAVRVNRRELLELQVDGTAGSAVAGLRDCAVQHRVVTPMPVWNPDLPDPIDYQALWSDVPDNVTFDNGFKVEWELFLTCAAEGRPFAWDLAEGAKGVQLANLALQSSADGRRAVQEDNLAALAEAAELGTDTLVLVCGGLPPGRRDLGLARRMVADAIAELVPEAQRLGVRLGVEALHPMFCADRCVISSLGEAVDLALRFPADAVGVVVDTYHVWWDARLAAEIARARGRIVSYQVCDWVLPLPADALLGRGHLGDGVIDFWPVTAAVAAAGYDGFVEVEIFNAAVWDAPPDQTAATVRERFASVLGGAAPGGAAPGGAGG